MLGFINYWFVQWFFVRICRVGEKVDGEFKQTGWGVLYFVWPLSGWGTSYKQIGKLKTKRVL